MQAMSLALLLYFLSDASIGLRSTGVLPDAGIELGSTVLLPV